jgi:cytoskeletal protein RodZ
VTLEPPAVVPEPTGTIRCPRCNAPVGPDQDWCLECGAAARTRLAQTPNWRLPIIVVAVVAILAGAGLAVAFVALTNDSTSAPATTSAPAVATEPAAAPPPTTPPATTAPPTTTSTVPAASNPTLPTPSTPATTDKQP